MYKRQEQNTAGTDTQDTDQNRREQELHSIVAEGMEYIRHLRDLNDRIEGEAISEKLYRLENLLKEIFDRVQEHPEQMHRMHKLMDYYLPTMLKLVEQYAEFDEISSPGEDILDAKKEIEKTLDMINQAFVTLLNNLFRDAAFDASASSFPAIQALNASASLASTSSITEFMRLTNVSLTFLLATTIPRPNSALSSNSEFAQAGPLPHSSLQ